MCRVLEVSRSGYYRWREGKGPFYPFDIYEELVTGAEKEGPETLAIVLLGGDAGLRASEKRALFRTDLGQSEGRRWIRVQRTTDDGTDEFAPKGGKFRTVPLTKRLARALDSVPVRLRDLHVFLDRHGEPLTRKMIRGHVNRAQRAAGLPETGDHILRHTFCSHLALRGEPLPLIKELAGHKSIKTTMRYAHLLPDSKDEAIRTLEKARRGQYLGNKRRRKRRSGS
jgi:integrase